MISACGGDESQDIVMAPLDAIEIGCITDDKKLVARSMEAAEADGQDLPTLMKELGAIADAGEDELFVERCNQLLAIAAETETVRTSTTMLYEGPELSEAEVLTGLTETLAPSILGPDEPVGPNSTAACAAQTLVDRLTAIEGETDAIARLQAPAWQGESGFASEHDKRLWWDGYYECKDSKPSS